MTTQKKYKPLAELISLLGKRAIITGGARGIGFATAYRLSEAGASVAIVDTNSEQGEKARQELAGYGYQVVFFPCDISKEDEVAKIMEWVEEKLGGIDILINNAGIFPHIPLADMTAADFDRIMAVNLKGVFLATREASRRMIAQNSGGCIINIASIDAVHPSHKGLSAYDASKGGVLTFTKSIALELAKHDIRVNAIAPGVVLTEGVLSTTSGLNQGKGSRGDLRSIITHIPMGKMGIADDIARVALFLASDLSGYMTGSLVVADGGYLLA